MVIVTVSLEVSSKVAVLPEMAPLPFFSEVTSVMAASPVAVAVRVTGPRVAAVSDRVTERSPKGEAEMVSVYWLPNTSS